MQTQWDIKNAVSTEITPLEVLEDLLGKLTEEAGNSGDRHLTISFDELFKISGALHSGLNNIKRVIGEEHN